MNKNLMKTNLYRNKLKIIQGKTPNQKILYYRPLPRNWLYNIFCYFLLYEQNAATVWEPRSFNVQLNTLEKQLCATIKTRGDLRLEK